ncbi:unnamed protein product [Clonostachys rosea f. rosea IK726]|nr:unnamed protein product [Clonostachys rosea f. rosea IK726]
MGIKLRKLDRSDVRFQEHEQEFNKRWQHRGKYARVQEVFLARDISVSMSIRGIRFNRYRNGAPWMLLYHGTQRACYAGESGDSIHNCSNAECKFCSILKESFKISEAGSRNRHGMFGKGIYTTPIASKADNYAKNHHIRSQFHAIILCRVVCDKPQLMHQADHSLVAPSSDQYNCVTAVTKANGGSVEYPEIVVYRDDAIVPVGVILYTREGWAPRRQAPARGG